MDGGGGAGDTLIVPADDNVLFSTAEFSAAATAFEILEVEQRVNFEGDDNANIVDLSGFTVSVVGSSLNIYGYGGADTIIGNVERDLIHGGGGENSLSGMDGNDHLTGGTKADVLNGGAGRDTLAGKDGDDTCVYAGAWESTGSSHDAVVGFDAQHDNFDVVPAIDAVDAAITAGTLTRSAFDSDLAAAVDAEHLGANDAVVFTPDAGHLAGITLLIVDLNGTAGYQAGEDLVVTLKNATHLDEFSAGNFI